MNTDDPSHFPKKRDLIITWIQAGALNLAAIIFHYPIIAWSGGLGAGLALCMWMTYSNQKFLLSLRGKLAELGKDEDEMVAVADRRTKALQRIRDREYNDTNEEATIMWMQAVAADALDDDNRAESPTP